jgi:signal transduction histidine kinase
VRAAGRGAETADRAGEIAILVNELASAAEDTNQALQNALQAMHGTGREGGAAGESIRREAETQKLIAEQLRTYSSASPENVESVEINALADRILRETMQAAGGVNVQKNLDALPSTIEAEPQLLEQAWRYVLRRSLAAMTAGGTLVVETERTNQKEVVLSVWHTAHSLNEQAQRPGESPAAGPDGGKRWALAYPIAHRIARLHGGDFSVSRHDDRGTRAVFTFPVAPDNAEQ